MKNVLHHLLGKTIDDAGCLVWQGGCSNGHPSARVNGKTQLVRRVIWEALRGQIPSGKVIRMTCETPLCINPDCMSLTTHQAIAKANGAMGLMSGVVRSAAIARAKQASALAINYDIVHTIRTSDATGVDLAMQFGVSQNLISKVRTNKTWKQWANNPFAGLSL